MAGIMTRGALDKIIRNGELTEEQKTEQIFALYGRALDDGYISKTAAEEQKTAAVEAAKSGIKIPDPVDPKTTPEYMDLLKSAICSGRSAERISRRSSPNSGNRFST